VGETPHAFTARYFGSGADDADETGLARELAARYRAELRLIDIRPELGDMFEPIAWALDEPHADDSAIPTWLLSRAVGADYKVALTGIGGDELFAGYRRHVGMLAGELYGRLPRTLQRALSATAGLLREPRGAACGVDRLKRFVRPGGESAPGRFVGYLSRVPDGDRGRLYTSSLRDRIAGSAARTHFAELYRRGGAPEGLSAGMYLDYKTYLPDDILALSDRLAMAHSLEIRVPFVDHELAARVFPLPYHLKIGWWRNKRLLKRAMRPRLPAAHFGAPKRGFVGPTSAWLRNELREMVQDELSPARQRRLGYFDPSMIEQLLREHMTGRHNRERILW